MLRSAEDEEIGMTMKTKNTPLTVYRRDYTPPNFFLDRIALTFRLDPQKTIVTARSTLRRNQNAALQPLRLDGENLKLLSIVVNGVPLSSDQYRLTDQFLEIDTVADALHLEIVTEINPDQNTDLSGLYRSNGNYCTQCEAEGFRRITYFIDRPDILTRYTTRVEGKKEDCPVLLANGNLTESGDMEDGWHFAVWTDPFPKPCYLFALVAGRLVHIEDWFTTASGRKVCLRIYVEERNKDKCGHAMRSLQKAMRWDEEVYGREYDLDLFMIVAVDDFNMGAMENKGLNVFNSKYVLETPATATDQDYIGIEGVVAHEYFHNWTGNRITCRDWFQLSLKEGLTVFRDQEFSCDMNSRAVQRIDDVNQLRNFQFREDAGPMAHPVRPDSYVEINNFYTSTVYNKGAEVVRMIHTLLGPKKFRAGTDLYFQRHDGQAVTCDDFVAAMQDASGVDLGQFVLWYSQSGTPELTVSDSWDKDSGVYSLTVRQACPATPGQERKKPFHIPLAVGLLDSQGNDILENETGVASPGGKGRVLELRQQEQTFTFGNIQEKPTLSFLRDFSAPVKVNPCHDREELAFLMAYDSDLFNRWDAADRLSTIIILDLVEALRQNREPVLDEDFIQAIRMNLVNEQGDNALTAQALTLPAESYLAGQMETIDPDLLHRARLFVRRELAMRLRQEFIDIYRKNCEQGPYTITPEAMGRRSLKNICLSFLMAPDPVAPESLALCLAQYRAGSNMTDVVAALSALANYPGPEREDVLEDFYNTWKSDPLVMDKWLILQATSSLETSLERVKALLHHPAFSIKNPNKIRSLIGAFCSGNHVRFHDGSGAGYEFLTEQLITIDRFNAQIAARMVSPFINWRKYEPNRQRLMKTQLEHLAAQEHLSNDLYEIVKKSL
jgi:aminopeptidase N